MKGAARARSRPASPCASAGVGAPAGCAAPTPRSADTLNSDDASLRCTCTMSRCVLYTACRVGVLGLPRIA